MGLSLKELLNPINRIFKPVKKLIKKIVKPIARGVRSIGRDLKKGFGKVAKAFGKLGPLGSIALSLILPGLGGALSGWLNSLGPVGQFIVRIGEQIGAAASYVKEGVGRVFSSITNGIEMGMNAVSRPFMEKGARGMGSAFRDFVSNATGGAIDRSSIVGSDATTGKSIFATNADGVSLDKLSIEDRLAAVQTDTVQSQLNDAQYARDLDVFHAKEIKTIAKIDDYKLVDAKGKVGKGFDFVEKTNPKTGNIEFFNDKGELQKSFSMPEAPTLRTIPKITAPAPGATDPTNMWSRLNDPDIGFVDAVKNSDNAKMYGRITALQSYDYLTNPDDLSVADMDIMRSNGVKNTQRAQESLARVDNNNYSTGPAPYQIVNANEMGNQDPYAFYLNQIYGQSFANVNQSQQQYLAQNAPGYGATFQDFAMMSYV